MFRRFFSMKFIPSKDFHLFSRRSTRISALWWKIGAAVLGVLAVIAVAVTLCVVLGGAGTTATTTTTTTTTTSGNKTHDNLLHDIVMEGEFQGTSN